MVNEWVADYSKRILLFCFWKRPWKACHSWHTITNMTSLENTAVDEIVTKKLRSTLNSSFFHVFFFCSDTETHCPSKWCWNWRSQLWIFHRTSRCVWFSANHKSRYMPFHMQQAYHLLHQLETVFRWLVIFFCENSDVQDMKGKMKNTTKCHEKLMAHVGAVVDEDARIPFKK